MKKILAIAIVLLVCVVCVWGAFTVMEMQVPELRKGVYLYDCASIIDKEDTKVLKSLLSEVEVKAHTNVYVVTMASNKENDVDAYADKAFEKMKLNVQRNRNGNVLICFSKNEKKVAVRTTHELSEVFNKNRIAGILNKYYEPCVYDSHSYAIQNSVTSMVMAIASNYDADVTNFRFSSPYDTNPFVELAVIIGLLIVALVSMIVILNMKRR